ncbi:hypothetical protein [Geomesophilobacter sediminis]|uniref:Uncharacterized protein n=1 Tax=Geomesophilobacter sediminis TaxID=2798584 RepID=A0A8J7M1W5_9BACT|nr:hypothetical protein [Geomesophilobacter sediminis]MBJ6727178.1 hypothetical protein [Geomesophilobacter sediminis]
MALTLPESDWKYLKRIKDELLADLCRRINEKAVRIVQRPGLTEHEKYQKLYRHIEDSDKIVANCFDDWRHSNLWLKVVCLRKHKLLSDDHLKSLSGELRDRLELLNPQA